MSDNSIANGCLVHYNDQHIQVRRDFFDLCAYSKDDFNKDATKGGKKVKDEPNQECMAKILRLLETLTNHEKQGWHLKAERLRARGLRPPSEPKEYRIELAYSTIVTLLYGTYGESTVRKSVAVLLERGYIKRYQKSKNSVPCYVLNMKTLQAALDKQAQEAISEHAEDELLNLTPEENELSILTPELSILTPENSRDKSEVLNLTPNNIREMKDKKDCKKADSSIHSSSISLSSEEQRVYDFACSELFKANSPGITPKLKEECEKLAKHIKTLEQFQSLLNFVRTLPYIKGPIHLKNLVTALNGWLQIQNTPLQEKPQARKKPISYRTEAEWVASMKADPWA